MKKQTLILLLTVLALLAGAVFMLQRSKTNTPSVIAPNLTITNATTSADDGEGEERVVEENVELYFTKAGCTSFPYIAVLNDMGEERASTTEISANDGYNYAVIDGSRAVRSMLSRFDGSCGSITPKEIDSFQVFDIGPTQTSP